MGLSSSDVHSLSGAAPERSQPAGVYDGVDRQEPDEIEGEEAGKIGGGVGTGDRHKAKTTLRDRLR